VASVVLLTALRRLAIAACALVVCCVAAFALAFLIRCCAAYQREVGRL
jgi:hypothetical protein